MYSCVDCKGSGCDACLIPDIQYNENGCKCYVFSQLCQFVFGCSPFVDIEDEKEWLARLALPVTDPLALRIVEAVGAIVEPDRDTGETTKGVVVYDNKQKFTLDLISDDICDELYEIARSEFACPKSRTIWAVNKSCKVFGGNEGITVNSIANIAGGDGTTDLLQIIWKFNWTASCSAPMNTYPLQLT